jgi:hypothetical protein
MNKESKIYEKAMRLSDADFKQIIGVTKDTYEQMLDEIRSAYAAKHQRRGCHAKLALEDILFMSLKYWRQYVTQKELAFEFEVGEATVHDWIVWVEDTLIKCGKFSLPGRKALLEDMEIEVVLVDVLESPIERPKKNKRTGTPEKRSGTPKKRS